ncbi:alpha/beta hydrolase fold domain-containing protein [Streptomyces aquilus]|uniref:alpha/beta hydrolase fold domain-containing protein n=1 Tax=Streptomyces aquilus TaxID=2548456 RepID=UPI003687825F
MAEHTNPGDRVTSAGEARVRDALVYAEPPGFRPLELDLYLPPAGGGPAPLIVFVHGGGWLRGSRKVFVPTFSGWRVTPFERLATQGFAVASVDYRLSGEARFPAPLADVGAALDWLIEQADRFGLDADRVVLWGVSAGAHLASLLALRGGRRLSGVIDWYGPADLLAMAGGGPEAALSSDPDDTREARLLGAPAREVPDLAREASPISHVHAGSPPFLIAHGTADTAVPFSQSAALATALTEVGAEMRLDPVEGADHLWRGLADPESVFAAAVAFAREVTGLK